MGWIYNLKRNDPVALRRNGKKYKGYVVTVSSSQIIANFPEAPCFEYESGNKQMAAFWIENKTCILGGEYGSLERL